MKIIGIMACDPRGVIGYNGHLPWHDAEDLNLFRSMTNGHVMIMGRNTFDSIPKNLLLTRKAVVLSKTISNPEHNVHIIKNLRKCLNYLVSIKVEKAFMIGGEQISKLFLKNNLIEEFFLSVMDQEYKGDTFIELQLLKDFDKYLLKKYKNFTLYHYIKR